MTLIVPERWGAGACSMWVRREAEPGHSVSSEGTLHLHTSCGPYGLWVPALSNDLLDHQPGVFSELSVSQAPRALGGPPRGSKELAEDEVLDLRTDTV